VVSLSLSNKIGLTSKFPTGKMNAFTINKNGEKPDEICFGNIISKLCKAYR
jgi:hypothetical protein